MGRSLIALTTLSGGTGLGLALGYVLLVVFSFVPGGERIAAFMIGVDEGAPGFGFMLLAIPYALLLGHLWLRNRVAAMLIDRGDTELAEQFASARLNVGLLRGKREALANRTALMRLAIRNRDYEHAEQLAAKAELPRARMFGPSDLLAAFHRWRLEAVLRDEDLVLAKRIVEQAWPIGGRGDEAAAFCAVAAELAVRNRDHDGYVTWRDRARYASSGVERLAITRLFAARRFEAESRSHTTVPTKPKWLEDVPGAALELRAVRAALLAADGAVAEAEELLGGVSELIDTADRRATHVYEAVQHDLEAED